MSLVVVTGATGTQGGSVARQLARNTAWKVRGLTRNVESTKAEELQSLGVEMVCADLSDASTLPPAFDGAVSIFCVTAFFENVPRLDIEAAGKEELQQFINVATVASKLPSLKHLVLSTMPHCDKISGGALPVPHWDFKALAVEYIKTNLTQLANKTTYVWLGWYLDNMANHHVSKPQPYLGRYVLAQPSKPDAIVPVAGIVAINLGIAVEAILAQPNATFGKYVPILTDLVSWTELGEAWGRATGEEVVCAEFSDSEYVKLLGPFFGLELARQYRFSERHPDWYAYHPEDTVSLEQLGVLDKVVGLYKGLEVLKDKLKPTS